MWRCLLCQFWVLFLQFYVLLVLFLRKLQLVPDPALGSVRAVGYEQHLLLRFVLLLLLFLLEGCRRNFMGRRLLCQFWVLFLQFCVLLVLFLRIEITISAGSCFSAWFGPWSMSSICCSVCCSFCCCFCSRAADAISCGGACPGRSGCCFCSSMCCLSCFCAFKLQLVPVLALCFVRALRYEHLLFLLLVFLLKGCWSRFMWRCLLWQVGMLFLQFYVLLVLFLCIEIAIAAGSCFGFRSGSGA